MILYAITVFLGAFLLFQVQPILAKVILPWFGGAAAVWSACLMFYQVFLLLGYLYAHAIVRRLRVARQAAVHAALAAVSLLALHVMPSESWKPAGGEDPVFRIVLLLVTSVGLPYFLLAATGPLLQSWYARVSPAALPYRLYAISNLACLLALLGYPVFIEPRFATSNQVRIWSAGYVVFVVLSLVCAIRTLPRGVAPAGDAADPDEAPSPRWPAYLLWTALAACSSALLLAVTNYMTENVAPVPFLWVLPLGLYLLSFVLTFSQENWYRPGSYIGLLALALGGMSFGVGRFDGSTPLKHVIPLFAAGLFVSCMFCHGELARRKPHARRLTNFYLTIALGGALGGVFVGAVAPRVFRGFFELPVGIAVCAILGVIAFRSLHRWVWAGWVLLTLVLGVTLWVQGQRLSRDAIYMARNFYGVLRVTQNGGLRDPHATRTLINGTITHGVQFLDPERQNWPTTYYSRLSGVGLAIERTRRPGQRVGVIGLGAGTLAAYGLPGDYYRFYEINPLVVEVARRQFNFLVNTLAKVDIVVADARLALEREPPQQFDVLAVDAFTGDSIPVHLLTLEAFQLYFRHLRPGGLLAVHISNTHLDLEPVVERLAQALHRDALLVENEDGDDLVYGASWVLIAAQADDFNSSVLFNTGVPLRRRPGLRTWTDDYSNLFQILR